MSAAASSSRTLAWWQLLRAANVFTAISNVLAGYLIAMGHWPPKLWGIACLVAASALIYLAAMVLNDAFDAETDRIERPDRPVPSGRVSRAAAFVAGWSLLSAGLLSAVIISGLSANAAPAIIAACLAVMVVLYDGELKSTWAGPWAIGFCRTLNVLLGASGSTEIYAYGAVWAYASLVGAYTVGLTYAARSEMVGDVARTLRVRHLVTRLLQGFIVIDALAATIAAGWPSGLAVLALLIPTILIARRTPMT